MKLILALCIPFVCISSLSRAQEEATPPRKNTISFYDTPYKLRNSGSFGRRSSIFSIGYGVASAAMDGGSYWETFPYSMFGPWYFNYQRGVTDEIGVGLQLATAFDDVNFTSAVTSIGTLGYYHFNKLLNTRRLDLYVGAGLSVRFGGQTMNQYDPNFLLMGKFGARLLIGNGFGIYAEGCADGMSVFNAGISWGRLSYRMKTNSADADLRQIEMPVEDEEQPEKKEVEKKDENY